MSAMSKALFDNLVDRQVTRSNSPRILQESKSKDFDVSSHRSPLVERQDSGARGRYGKMGTLSVHADGLSPASAERAFKLRYGIINENFARGAYGKVELAKDNASNEKVVIKRIPRNTPIKMIQAEIRAGQLIGQHPNIANFHKYHDFVDHHVLVFQFIDGMDLFTHLEQTEFTPKTEPEARAMLLDILMAVKHIHSKKIAHRDIKLENILLDKSGKAYLIDFGLSSVCEEKLSREWCGSDNYLCPQIVRRIPYDGFKADIFSIGVVAFALIFGVFPFDCLFVNSRFSHSTKPLPRLRVRFPADVNVSNDAKDLLLSMLEDMEDARYTIDEVLAHKWFTGTDDPILTKLSSE